MKQHKWHKEIKAWADGAEIEYRDITNFDYATWKDILVLKWDDSGEFRIKPQPKEKQYLYLYKESNSSEIVIKEDEELNWSESYSIYIGKIEVQDD